MLTLSSMEKTDPRNAGAHKQAPGLLSPSWPDPGHLPHTHLGGPVQRTPWTRVAPIGVKPRPDWGLGAGLCVKKTGGKALLALMGRGGAGQGRGEGAGAQQEGPA